MSWLLFWGQLSFDCSIVKCVDVEVRLANRLRFLEFLLVRIIRCGWCWKSMNRTDYKQSSFMFFQTLKLTKSQARANTYINLYNLTYTMTMRTQEQNFMPRVPVQISFYLRNNIIFSHVLGYIRNDSVFLAACANISANITLEHLKAVTYISR